MGIEGIGRHDAFGVNHPSFLALKPVTQILFQNGDAQNDSRLDEFHLQTVGHLGVSKS
jgi:hypothetical protein